MPASPAPNKLGFGTSLDPGILSSSSSSISFSPSSTASSFTLATLSTKLGRHERAEDPSQSHLSASHSSQGRPEREQRVPEEDEPEEELFLLDEETETQPEENEEDRMDVVEDGEGNGKRLGGTPRRSPPPPLPTSSPFKMGRWRKPSRQKYDLDADEDDEEAEEDVDDPVDPASPNLYGSSLPIEIRRPSASSLTSSSVARKSSLTAAMNQRSKGSTALSPRALTPPPASPPSSPPENAHFLSRTLITGDPRDEAMYAHTHEISGASREGSRGFIAPHEFSARSYVGEREGLWGAVPMSSSRVDLVGRRSSLHRSSQGTQEDQVE
ncbi:hypothetical protein BJ684DRAFT_17995 [Piptocephalis cylindrospora]|uniref:Uncharacterized protein n=1 Tax=Piptocephalis cylindrospora TaxID=1907219 RepID=A0A4P9Y0U5_9FUNG|nr:hypothetical protein BJ684DRAFT_17995 [Piptocephalis cylindrospora]|eukprot:RKP11410.1 hypothetical protein BJ684DRAFT_17995 [Piptocephalis cylindrospora]